MATGYSPEWTAHNSMYTARFRIYYSTSYNASTNQSTVTITPQLKTSTNFGSDYRVFNGAGLSGAGVYGNGVCLYSFGSNYGSGNYLRCGSAHDYFRDLGSWSFTVSHNANGDASFTVGIYGSVLAMYFSGTGYTYAQCFIGTVGAKNSSTITIHENAASTIASAPSSIATRETLVLTMRRLAASNYHIATFKYNNSTTLYTSGRFDTQLDFAVPRSWFEDYPSIASLPVTVSVQTYNSSGTAIGSPATASLTVNADADMKPVVSSGWASLAPYNTGAVSGITGYVKGYSQAEAAFDDTKVDMSNAVGAGIVSFSVTCQGETDSYTPYLTPVLASTSVSVVCAVTDTRGRTASEAFTLTVMDYAKPVLTGIEIFRCDAFRESHADLFLPRRAERPDADFGCCRIRRWVRSGGNADKRHGPYLDSANLGGRHVHGAYLGDGLARQHGGVLPGAAHTKVGDEVPTDGKRRRVRQSRRIQ